MTELRQMFVCIVSESNPCLCLDVSEGPNVFLRERNGGESQHFLLNRGRIVSRSQEKALESSIISGKHVLILSSSSKSKSQLLNFRDDKTITDFEGKCLDCESGELAEGEAIVLAENKNTPSQKWRAVRFDDPLNRALYHWNCAESCCIIF